MSKIMMMVDIETLSQSPRAAIISIGACTFDKNGIIDTFKVNIKPESAKEVGMVISKDTLDWWANQPKEVWEAALDKNVYAQFGLSEFVKWIEARNPSKVWAQGVQFDITILEHAFGCVGLRTPWKFWDIMDTRTLFNMFGINTKSIHEKYGSAHHDALSDAVAQTKALIEVLAAMGWGEDGGPLKI